MSKKPFLKANLKSDPEQEKQLIRQALGEPVPREAILKDIRADESSAEIFRSFSETDRERVLAYLSGEKTLQILYDKFFQKILNPEMYPERLQSLLSAVFGQKVEIVKTLSREGMMITEAGSQVVMDIIVRLQSGALVTVEMQRIGYLFPGERSSCYLADMIMRQYGMIKEQTREAGGEFSYRDMKPVHLLVIMDKSPEEFIKAAPEYIHRRVTSYDSKVEVKTLENVVYISLDTFRKRAHNKINTDLDAWLAFFTAEEPKEVLELIRSRPEFLSMYQDIAEFRKKPSEVIGMFSEALRIMDRNTTKYMIDELKRKAEEAEQKLAEAEQKAEQRVEEAEQTEYKKLISKVCRKLQEGKDDERIADELVEEIDDIRRITAVAGKMGPDYDVERIYEALNGIS